MPIHKINLIIRNDYLFSFVLYYKKVRYFKLNSYDFLYVLIIKINKWELNKRINNTKINII